MPTVLVVDGFSLRIYLPPREHGPPHVHVVKAGARVVVELGDERTPPSVREVIRMRSTDVTRAVRIVEAHRAFMLTQWRKHHG